MGKKTHVTSIKHRFFNNRNPKSSVEDMISLFEEEAQKVLASYNSEKKLEMWVTVKNYYTSLANSWDYIDPSFKRFWLDLITYEMGLLIWNSVWENERVSGAHDKQAEMTATKHQEMFSRKFL